MYFCRKVHAMEFSVKNVTGTIKSVVLTPVDFWENQKETKLSQKDLLLKFFLPVLFIIALAVFTGELIKSNNLYIDFAALKAMREILLFLLQYFIAVFLTSELMKTFGAKKNTKLAQILVVYSLVPILLVSFVSGLFQFLYVIDVLGMYSFYIFWIGANHLLDFPDNKKARYIIITLLVNFFVFSFLSILLSKFIVAYF